MLAALARGAGAGAAPMPDSGAISHRQQARIDTINTAVSLRSVCKPLAGRLGYSVFGVSWRRLKPRGLRATVGVGLQSAGNAHGGIDLPAQPVD
jgi:hypothetical protein